MEIVFAIGVAVGLVGGWYLRKFFRDQVNAVVDEVKQRVDQK